jgi:hypothetical protein
MAAIVMAPYLSHKKLRVSDKVPVWFVIRNLKQNSPFNRAICCKDYQNTSLKMDEDLPLHP